MLRQPILLAARSSTVRSALTGWGPTRGVVDRFVGGSDHPAAVDVVRTLVEDGLCVSLDHLGEDTTDAEQARAAVAAYRTVLTALDRAGLTDAANCSPLRARVDVSVKLSAVGLTLGADGERIALEHAREICTAARDVGATVTVDMEDHTTTDATLAVLGELRADFPNTAAVIQSYLHRSEGDCRDLASAGSRVRLCKGAYAEPESVAFQRRLDVDRSYVRCMNTLLAGDGYPMFATHDPQLIEIIGDRARVHGKTDQQMEYQLLYGIRPNEQSRLAADGHTVRVYVPYGTEWFGYLMRRLAERPANLTFFARALASRS